MTLSLLPSPRKEIETIIPIFSPWLRSRGLELNQEKTHIVHVEEGFNFLWVNIPQFKISCFTIPQKEKLLDFLLTYKSKRGTTLLILLPPKFGE